jgi:hypothetical protein
MFLSPIDLQTALAGARYPASRDDLLFCADINNACRDVLDALSQLDEGDYESPAAVSAAVSTGAL